MTAGQAGGIVVGAVGLAAGVAAAVGPGVVVFAGVPAAWWLAGLCFVLNWVAFVPAFLARTERFYDLVGSATFMLATLAALGTSGHTDARALVPAALVLVWAGRLGSFLFARVHQDGGDGRFDEIKQSAPRFLVAWTIQALWAFLTASAALVSITATTRPPVDASFVFGCALWALGFAIEVVADRQKRTFKKDPDRGPFIDSGLWAWSRHPNYFGEILLWTGLFVASAATLSGGGWAVGLSPIFVAVLLTRVSGIPILEARADARLGDSPAWKAYKARTPVLVPWPPRPRGPGGA